MGFGQNDVQTLYALGRQAKENGENAKAIQYFEELYDKTNQDPYYNELIELYALEEQYDDAEKIIKKRIRSFSDRPELLVDRGHIYELQKDERQAEKYYKEAIDEVENNEQKARQVANQFVKYNRYDFAEKTYLKVRSSAKNNQLFRFELATAYAQQGKTEEMVEEYLNVLAGNRGYIQTIQNLFQRVLHPDPEGIQMENLKNQLLRRIQKNPEQEVFSELLIWLYIQDRNFTGALLQAKALDRRANENGKRIYSLGELSLANNEYSVAEEAFNYVISYGDENPYYLNSRMKLVEVLKAKVTSDLNYTTEDLEKLRKTYANTISDLRKSAFTLSLIRGEAELYAYYLDSISTAISILEEAVLIPGISKQEKAKIKIDLADLMLLSGETWEASLLYSQVEKDFKYDRLGEIAKFKNAKIAFYVGDFYWSQAQLDVLKGSTSKLIANDAMELSLLITDNVGLDSISEPLEMYARADLSIFKKNYSAAEATLDSIPKYFPATSLKDDILLTKYKIEFKKKNYELAAKYLKQLLADYAEDILGDNALFYLAKLNEEQLDNKEEAMELYKRLLTTYPASLFVVESRKRFRNLRGDKLEEEIN
ncbi:MAG: tetratricopeptide repeat protein [Vicingaceae bacterium]